MDFETAAPFRRAVFTMSGCWVTAKKYSGASLVTTYSLCREQQLNQSEYQSNRTMCPKYRNTSSRSVDIASDHISHAKRSVVPYHDRIGKHSKPRMLYQWIKDLTWAPFTEKNGSTT